MEDFDNEVSESKIRHDARKALCDGLLKRIALRKEDNKPLHADNAYKQLGPFYCKECFSDAIIRKCTEKNDHFAHKGRLSKLIGNDETELHQECKSEILTALQKAFPEGNWAIERPLAADKIKGYSALVPDLSGRINKRPVIIEIQRSSLNVKLIRHRTNEYTKRGAAILWLVPLKEKLGTDYFRPRLFERFLHSIYYGRIYYWQKGFGLKVLPVHFSSAQRWIEESTWFDPDMQEERSEGGFFKFYKTIRKPTPTENFLEITSDFVFEKAEEWQPKNEELKVPERLIFRDRLQKWWTDSNDD